MFHAPSAAIVTNHAASTTPNTAPTRPEPNRCSENSARRITTAIGTMNGLKTGVATSSPSTALRTEIAGVMTPSPYSSAAPRNPSVSTSAVPCCRDARSDATCAALRPTCPPSAIASNARIPPSPRLSARMMIVTYFTLTTMMSDQTNSDTAPRTLSGVTAMGYAPPKHSCNA